MVFKCGKKKKGRGYIALAVLLAVTFMASSAFALYDAPNKQVEMYVIENVYAAGEQSTTYLTTSVSVATIIPGTHRILGFSVMPSNTSLSSERVVGLYDCVDTVSTDYITSTYVFDEFEAAETNAYADRWYPYPRALTSGLTVRQGSNTIVTIYYEDTRKF